MENQVPPDFEMPQCADVPDSERIDSCRRDINHIYGVLEKLETTHYFGEERLRRDRWHATFNATVQGLLGGAASNWELLNVEKLHEAASSVADQTHGPLDAAGEV